MSRLREKIKRLHQLDLIPILKEKFQIPNLSRRIARNINHPLRPKREKLLQKKLIRTTPRRIDHDRSLLSRKIDSRKNRRGIPRKKRSVSNLIFDRRSEERRVGKESGERWAPRHEREHES